MVPSAVFAAGDGVKPLRGGDAVITDDTPDANAPAYASYLDEDDKVVTKTGATISKKWRSKLVITYKLVGDSFVIAVDSYIQSRKDHQHDLSKDKLTLSVTGFDSYVYQDEQTSRWNAVKGTEKKIGKTQYYLINKGDAAKSVKFTASIKRSAAPKGTSKATHTIKMTKSSQAQDRANVINGAVSWANKIAGDNSFHYGKGSAAHHFGCYFCNTNGQECIKVREGLPADQALKSYCCNPFVTAAFVHGGGIGTKCGTSKDAFGIGLAGDPCTKLFYNNFEEIEVPAKISGLKKGDILLTTGHCLLYAGSSKVVEAAYEDDGKKGSAKWKDSIRVKTYTASRYKNVKRVFRYMGKPAQYIED